MTDHLPECQDALIPDWENERRSAVIHDRLCYANADCESNETYLCDLIATVREEERDAAVNRVQALGWDVLTVLSSVFDALAPEEKK